MQLFPVTPDDELPPLPYGKDRACGTGRPLGPTDIPPGDPAKQVLMQLRVANDFQPHHPADLSDRAPADAELVRLGKDNLRNGAADLTGDYVPRSPTGYYADLWLKETGGFVEDSEADDEVVADFAAWSKLRRFA